MNAASGGGRLARTLLPIYAAAALRLLVPLMLLPMMAARLGADTFGRLGFILVWAGVLSLVVEGGFLASATRLAVRADNAARWRLASQVATARSVLTLAVLPLAVAVAVWAAPAGVPTVAATGAAQTAVTALAGRGGFATWSNAAAIAALACALGWPANWYLQATQQLGRWARVELVVYAVLLAASALLAHGLWSYLGLQWLATATLAWRGWAWLRRDLQPAVAVRAESTFGSALWCRPSLRPGLRLAWTMLPVSVAGAAYSYALPAVASGRLSAAELGVYFLADRLVRALLAAAEPVFSVVYPRIVALFAVNAGMALRYAARWAAGGFTAGALSLAAVAALRPAWQPMFGAQHGIDAAEVGAVLAVLGWLLPLLLGWKFIGYWMLASGRCDRAYRACLYAGGVVGVAGAAVWPGARTAMGLAQVALAAEGVVIVVAVAGAWLTFRWRA